MVENQAKIKDDYLFGIRSIRALLLVVVKEYMNSNYTCFVHDNTLQHAVVSLDKRLENVIETHEAVMTLYIDEIFKRSFLHLQRHQIQSIGLEIKMLFKCLKSSTLATDDAVRSKIIESESSIQNILIEALDIIKVHASDFVFGMAPLTQKQLSICLGIYKYRSELIILHSFISQSVMTIPDHLDQVETEIYAKGYHV